MAGADRAGSRPVEVIDGTDAPHSDGESWCFRTRGGTRIRHPNAYGKKGRSNMVYHASSLRVDVGVQWLRESGYRDYCKAGTVRTSCV